MKELEKVIDERDGRIQALSKELKKVEQKKSHCLQEKVRYSIFINIIRLFCTNYSRIIRTKYTNKRFYKESLVQYGEG